MTIEYFINNIKLQLTGGVLQSEIDDDGYKNIINLALQEMNRYYDETQLVETNAESCIDLTKLEENKHVKINSVSFVYRATGVGTTSSTGSSTDPMAVAYWNMSNNFGGYGTSKWAYRYMAYNTAQQISNTLSTDLAFKEDKAGRKLYVNYASGNAQTITIEFVPVLESVEQVNGNYWIDILTRLSLAYAKITLGRIRTRYTQTNALWTQDGEKLLEEGTSELNAIRERLAQKSNYFYPVD